MNDSVLSRLKDFQLRTVDYVFDRFYGKAPTMRFLIADEVGLGKTLVARGIIERAYEHMRDKVDHFNVIYVCSNAAIASQNLNRLNITESQDHAFATRLTFLPMQIRKMTSNKANFISFTPGTTFDLKRRGGTMAERALIYKMLRGSPWDQGRGLLNLLQGDVFTEKWRKSARTVVEIDPKLRADFLAALSADAQLQQQIREGCILYRRNWRNQRPWSHRNQALDAVGSLRQLLARVCVDALEPDLVILDEFQRFKGLLDGEDDTALLARALFNYPGVRTLLLSATPYRMLTLDADAEDHYHDFIRTLEFLTGGEVEELKGLIRDYRRELFSLDTDPQPQLESVRDKLQNRLLRVMCRTERVGMTRNLDAMLSQAEISCSVDPDDLSQAVRSDRVARALGVPDVVEYWKSSPYLLSFMREYQLGRNLESQSQAPSREVIDALSDAANSMITARHIVQYGQLDPGNPRMRSLFRNTLDQELWRLLWMPPSLSYSEPSGPYAEIGRATKTLVFSSWAMVPEAIASVCSYEAERRMLANLDRDFAYGRLYEALRPLLRFTAVSSDDQRLTGMPTLAWMMPSPRLALEIDPLEISLRLGQGQQVTVDQLLEDARLTCRRLLARLPYGRTGGRDERWYWAAPAMLEGAGAFTKWCTAHDGWLGVAPDREQGTRFADHVVHLTTVAADGLDNPGPHPRDIDDVIALLALAGPGTCALRALRRIAPGLEPTNTRLLSAAATIASGFRTLFNLPETIGLLRGGDRSEYYWRLALRYCLDGNLQAVLDEQCHVLVDSLGLSGSDEEFRVQEVSKNIDSALSIRSARVQVSEHSVVDGTIATNPVNMRSRFALKFGKLRDDRDSTLARADVVRDAFNSPFRPFILATTSIGQEGLDFHTWCHAVMHWNLPVNPVDLEQREGRVHRYKGHAVRKNVAENYGLAGLSDWRLTGDPWQHLFEKARADRPAGSTDMIPYWVYEEGSARIERRIPMLPMSREEIRLKGLVRALTLYRLVFGQPRQEDLLSHLMEYASSDEDGRGVSPRLRIDLQP